MKRQNLINKQNISALNDSVTMHKKKNGDNQGTINGLIATEKELRGLNKDLSKEVDEQTGKVVSLSKSVLKLNISKAAESKTNTSKTGGQPYSDSFPNKVSEYSQWLIKLSPQNIDKRKSGVHFESNILTLSISDLHLAGFESR